MADALIVLAALLFFAPLAFIYGRRLAWRLHEEAARQTRPVFPAALAFLWTPALLLACLAVRLADPYALAVALGRFAANPVLSAVLALMDTIGALALVLFFLAVPFILGRLFAVGAASLGYLRSGEADPLRPAGGGGQEGAASEGDGDGRTE